jgi:hypothetical protein
MSHSDTQQAIICEALPREVTPSPVSRVTNGV